jgi:hypothetical protein
VLSPRARPCVTFGTLDFASEIGEQSSEKGRQLWPMAAQLNGLTQLGIQ